MSLFLDIHKNFGSFNLDIAFNIGSETLGILGASGCGKSLTLACIAGIIKPDKGKIILNDKIIFDSGKKINVKIQNRHVGLMFQNYALFPNMTVEENLLLSHANKNEITESLNKFGLFDIKNLYPSQISGGQQQRTALARMILSRPEILMFDEPFSALDSHLRFQTERELISVFKNFTGSVILVSHNRDEVFRLCSKIAVIHKGKVEVIGKKNEVFNNPKTKNAAILTGCKNISRLRASGKNRIFALDWGIELECSEYENDIKFAGIRMHSISNEIHEKNFFECKVVQVIENPFSFTVMVIPKNANTKNVIPIGWETEKSLWQKIKSETVKIYFPPEDILLLKE